MKRVVLLILAAVAVTAAFVPSTAAAAVPCRDRIYNDWYKDGKIATSYPIACYRDALEHIRSDALTYSSLGDDIRAAMQGAIALKKGNTNVPAQIGKGVPATPHSEVRSNKPSTAPHDPSPGNEPVSSTLPTSTVAAGVASGTGSSVPVPLLVLGGLALLLTAVGGVGVLAKRRRT